MSECVISVRLPETLLQDASEQARRSGVSVEKWFVDLAANSIRYQQAAERFFNHPPNPDARRRMMEILDSVKGGPPIPGDELPE